MLKKDIEFTLIDSNLESAAEFPTPAIKNLPDWYKNMPPYIGEKQSIDQGNANLTLKKCVPVLDALSSGYIIKTWTDINFSSNSVTWSVNNVDITAVEGHSIDQIPGYPISSSYKNNVYKWINPWHIKTPKGYSTLFVTPVGHHLPFKIIEGVVDTDTFPLTINFPFFLNKNFEGIIPYGTPMVQLIPFKRDYFQSKKGKYNNDDYQKNISLHNRTFVNKYKKNWWTRKEYK